MSKPHTEHEEFAEARGCYFLACGRGILVVGTDTRGRIGVRSQQDNADAPDHDRMRRPIDILHDNVREREVHTVVGRALQASSDSR